MFEWSSRLEVGIPSIDNQHRELVSMLARLFDAMQSGAGSSVLGEILGSLEHYAQKHFAEEEALMAQHDYHDRDSHRAAHAIFQRKVNDLKEQHAQNDQGGLSVQVVLFLRNWLTEHIANVDQLLGDFLQEQEAG